METDLKLFELSKKTDRHNSKHWLVWANNPTEARFMLQDHVHTFENNEVKNRWGEQLTIDEVEKAPGFVLSFEEYDHYA